MAEGPGKKKRGKKKATKKKRGVRRKRPEGSPSDDFPRPLTRLHLWQIQFVRDLLVVGLAIFVVWLGYALRAVTVPLLVALILAYLFEPLVTWTQSRTQWSRPVIVGVLLSTVGVMLLFVLAAVASLAVSQTSQLVAAYRANEFYNAARKLEPAVPETFAPEFEALLTYLGTPDEDDDQPVEPQPEDEADGNGAQEPPSPHERPETGDRAPTINERQLREMVRLEVERQQLAAEDEGFMPPWLQLARTGVQRVLQIIGAVIGIGLLAFLIPFYFYFFSVAYPSILEFFKTLVPTRNRERTLELVGKMDEVVAGFIRGRLVISLIMGVMLAIGWRVFGVPYSVVLGLVTGIFCAVPYLGVVGVPLAVGLLAFQKLGNPDAVEALWWGGAWWGVVIWPSLIFGAVQFIEGYVLIPAIAGKVTGLDPVTIIVAVLAGGSVMGIYGMILAIPLAACIKIVVIEVIMPQFKAWIRGEVEDPLPFGREK